LHDQPWTMREIGTPGESFARFSGGSTRVQTKREAA
jgi:hypothetical protein